MHTDSSRQSDSHSRRHCIVGRREAYSYSLVRYSMASRDALWYSLTVVLIEGYSLRDAQFPRASMSSKPHWSHEIASAGQSRPTPGCNLWGKLKFRAHESSNRGEWCLAHPMLVSGRNPRESLGRLPCRRYSMPGAGADALRRKPRRTSCSHLGIISWVSRGMCS